jgi:hypothetical protein
LASAPANAKPMQSENNEFNASGDIGYFRDRQEPALLRKIACLPPHHP